MKTFVVSLGCPKNLVDTEASISMLRRAGCTLTENPKNAELLIVSACSFLDVAWRETVDEVNRLSEVKHSGRPKKLILMGCLPRHRGENLEKSLPSVDYFLPTGAHAQLPSILEAWRAASPAPPPAARLDKFAGFEDRQLLTPPHTAYVKIAEGCDRPCSFCAIPKIRGRMISRSVESVVREVEILLERGVKEVSLLAQDITSYCAGGRRFTDLVDAVANTGVPWIRIFYVHPASLSLGLVERLFEHPSVCRYLESPVQHASDRVLKRMRRPYTRDRLERLFVGIREKFPEVRIRSEVIVGFPGEEDEDFEELKDFIAAAEFASLGIFPYSPEEGTPAASLDGAVPDGVKSGRAAELSDVQESVAFSLHSDEKGRRHRVLIDRRLEDGAKPYKGCDYAGRFYGQAYDVDGETYLSGRDLPIGDFVSARITGADVFDLIGEVP